MKQRLNTLALQVQQEPKEGILLRMQSATSSSESSKLKVPQVSPMIRPTCDPEKQGTRAKPSGDLIPRDQITRPTTLWTSKKSVDQQMADCGNGLQSTKKCDTSERITPVLRANCYWPKK